MPKLTVSRLPHLEHAGDWHDKPLRWVVTGAEVQKFSTKRAALQWATCRRRSASFAEAGAKFSALPY